MIGKVEADAQGYIIAKGVLPGLLQTVFRAELYAVVVALEIASLNGAKLFIRCDNVGVVKGVRRLLRGGRIRVNSPNADLWQRCLTVLDQHSEMCYIEHVQSHQETSPGDRGHGYFNGIADKTAVLANHDRGNDFWIFHRRHVNATTRMRDICREVQRVQLDVSRQAFCTGSDTHEVVVEAPQVFETPCPPAPAWNVEDTPPVGVHRKYSSVFVNMVVNWVRHVQHELSDVPAMDAFWVSSFQLYVDFMKYGGHCGPVYSAEGWITNGTFDAAVPYNFRVRCRWFTRVVTEILASVGNTLVRSYTRPRSTVLCLHTGCFALSWPQRRLDAVDAWFASLLKGTATRAGHIMATLPPARQDCHFGEATA